MQKRAAEKKEAESTEKYYGCRQSTELPPVPEEISRRRDTIHVSFVSLNIPSKATGAVEVHEDFISNLSKNITSYR